MLSNLEAFLAVLVIAALCSVAVYLRWLTVGGAVAATAMGVVIWVAGGWKLAMPMLVFFMSGSVLSRFGTGDSSIDKKHKKPRDHIQVFCNGGVAAICVMLFLVKSNMIFIAAYYLSIAAATADTWSSEIGMLKGGRVVDILTFKSIQKGLSGGVSIAGSLAGFLGACLMAILFFWSYRNGLTGSLLIAIGGFAGMLLDSIIGSKLQARYRLANGNLVEYSEAGKEAILEKGLPWMTNDLVNLLSNAAVTIISLALLALQ